MSDDCERGEITNSITEMENREQGVPALGARHVKLPSRRQRLLDVYFQFTNMYMHRYAACAQSIKQQEILLTVAVREHSLSVPHAELIADANARRHPDIPLRHFIATVYTCKCQSFRGLRPYKFYISDCEAR